MAAGVDDVAPAANTESGGSRARRAACQRRVLNSYDQVLYPGATYPQSHPERMATVARLFGLQPADLSRSRVLELGCGSGENLLPVAMQFPDASFHGVDLSAAHVALATASIADLGLRNITVEQADIGALPGRLPEYDYVIAHGVYSWVPGTVRDALLETCRRCLAPQGLAYVSHNVNPGWRSLGAVRDALLFHIRGLDDPAERLQQARALIEFMRTAIGPGNGCYRKLYDNVAASLQSDEKLRSYLFHDIISEHNEPVYFTQFVSHARDHGLRFVAEADLSDMSTELLGEQVATTLAGMGGDIVKREQYLDFIRNRAFRQTVLCHGDVRPASVADAATLATLCVACAPNKLRAVDASSAVGASSSVLDAEHQPREVTSPPLAAALRLASEHWPRAVPCEALVAGVRARLAAGRMVVQTASEHEAEERALLQGLLDLALVGAIELYSHSPPVVSQVSERPRASAWARYRIARGLPFCNLRNEPMVFADFTLRLVCLLDGERGHPALVEELMRCIERDDLVVCEEGRRLEGAELRGVVARRLQQQLEMLAASAMLEA